MRALVIIILLTVLSACGSSGGGDKARFGPPDGSDAGCSSSAQKQTTLDIAREWYLWNERLPAAIDTGDFGTVADLITYIESFSPAGSDGRPVDRFGGIGSAAEEQQFLDEGQYEGYGFSYRFVAADEVRVTRVYAGSPAAVGGLARGQQIVAVNGVAVADIIAEQGAGAFFDLLDTSPLRFTLRGVDGVQFETDDLARGIVTIDPVPGWRLIPRPGLSPVGYLEFAQFISTADDQLDAIFAEFSSNNITDVIVDLRYNGGGLLTTTDHFADLLGGLVATGRTFTEIRYNPGKAAENGALLFDQEFGRSISLSRLIVIASRGTASASELIANGLAPHVEVVIVGDDTFGKPVGQSGWVFCENVLRLTTFQLFNSIGYGDYFDGLPVTPGCAVPDDLTVAVGADDDPNVIAAMNYLATGSCGAAAAAIRKIAPSRDYETRQLERQDRPARFYADAL